MGFPPQTDAVFLQVWDAGVEAAAQRIEFDFIDRNFLKAGSPSPRGVRSHSLEGSGWMMDRFQECEKRILFVSLSVSSH